MQAQRESQRMDTAEIVRQFDRDGFALIPGVLSQEEAQALREAADAIFADPVQKEKHRHGFDFVIARLYEGPAIFQELAARPSIAEIVTAVLGKDPGVVGLNVIRNPPSVSISRWHVDDVLEFPLPPDVPRHDARARMPVQWLTVQVALSDIDTEAHGPTQCVPGSHDSGRHPNQEDLTFEGRGPVSIYCKAGDAYLQNHQCWHRGAPNTSDRTRYVLQLQYAQRWAIRRFSGIA